MIYSQVISNERFNPALALFKTAGLIRTTAGIQQTQAISDDSRNLSRSSDRSHVAYLRVLSFQPQSHCLYWRNTGSALTFVLTTQHKCELASNKCPESGLM
uniref:Uncharacterized protein n=1 Tax=Elaeophora elaphi TaxID=1147741 RepID=A0A0R3S1S5_9BILA